MSSGTRKSSRSTPKIADSRVYTYDKMIECQKKLNDSDDFQFDIKMCRKSSKFSDEENQL